MATDNYCTLLTARLKKYIKMLMGGEDLCFPYPIRKALKDFDWHYFRSCPLSFANSCLVWLNSGLEHQYAVALGNIPHC